MKKKKVLNVYISQPMRDRTDEEIKQERLKVTEYCCAVFPDNTVVIIDSFFEGAPHTANPLWFLGKNIQQLAGADVAVFTPGYENARGCMIEYACAKQYGIETIIELTSLR